jgi:hypothetical protein
MREYLDAEQTGPEAFSAALAPAMRSVIEELSSIAAVRGVPVAPGGYMHGDGAGVAAAAGSPVTMIEAQPAGGKVMLLLGEGAAGPVLRAEGERGFRGLGFRDQEQRATISQTKRDPSGATSTSVPTLRRVRPAIASRVLETAGASLVFADGDHAAGDPTGFVLRIPRRFDAPAR